MSQHPKRRTEEREGSGPAAARRREAEGPTRVLVRYAGELSTKSRRTRNRFVKRLVANLEDAFRATGHEVAVERGWSRLYLTGSDPGFVETVGRVFGISSYSPLEGTCPARLDDIVETGKLLFGERVEGRTYAVRARRAGTHPFSSGDIMRRLGAALNPGAEVDLDDPEVEVRVEVRDDTAYLFSSRLPGAGGLPLGVQGRAVSLLSGGFDSAVAAWMVMRRGVELEYVFCNLGGAAYKRMVAEVGAELADRWAHGSRPRLHVLDFGPLVDAMREAVKPAYFQVVLKRLMYRAGARVAARLEAAALVTGESVGQVSSQTLVNLRAIDGASDLPVLRPLLGFDKEEIVERARRIGTYELSARVREYCQVASDRPTTAAPEAEAEAQEARVPLDLLEAAVEEGEVLELRGLRPAEIVAGTLTVGEVPEGAIVLDTREPEAYRAWHWPGSERRDFDEMARAFGELAREDTYVLVCAQGLRTARLAERMQAAGYEAYSFRGGARALRKRDDGAL